MLIVGCGDLGTRLAARALQRGDAVTGLVRSSLGADRLADAGIPALVADLDQAAPPLVSAPPLSRVYYLAPPPAQGHEDPRMRRLLAALPEAPGQRILYISTTGVYGDCGGDWVDETHPARPGVDRARRRYDAEQQLRAWQEAGHGEVVILRVAGIYGPGKLPLARLRQGVPMVDAADAPWTNRIHIDDLVSVCEAAMARGRDGETYNVSDGQPGNMRDYFDRVADLYGQPRAPLISLETAQRELSPGMLSYLAESRRLDNTKMLRELGIQLRYPDLQSGLAACITVDSD